MLHHRNNRIVRVIYRRRDLINSLELKVVLRLSKDITITSECQTLSQTSSIDDKHSEHDVQQSSKQRLRAALRKRLRWISLQRPLKRHRKLQIAIPLQKTTLGAFVNLNSQVLNKQLRNCLPKAIVQMADRKR